MADEKVDQPAEQAPSENSELRALQETMFQIRSLETSIILDRLRWASQHGITFDGKRNEYVVFGYDPVVTYRQFRDEYARGGIAGSVVDVMPDACWRGETPFEVVEDEDPEADTEFEKAWKAISLKHNVPVKLQRADKLARLSTYSIILIGAPGQLEDELPRSQTGDAALLFLKPYSGGGGPGDNAERQSLGVGARATIYEYDEDPKSPRFGEPLTYQINFFQRRFVAGEPPLPKVHWSRIVHVPADNPLEDDIFGQPALERVWNLLADLRKVTGGGAEAFFLRANQGLHIDIDKDMALDSTKDTVDELKKQADAYKHQLDRWIRTRGVKVQTLGSDVANFANPADAIVTQIAGAKRVPKRILTGSEMGELASTQDRENFRDQVNGRQAQHCAPIIRRLIDRLVAYGYMVGPRKGPLEYQIMWSQIEVLTQTEKADGAVKWSQTKVGEDPVFTDAEIRDHWYGMEPLTEEQLKLIDDRKQKAIERQQAAMAKAKDEEDDDERPAGLRAAEDDEVVRILADAIRCDAAETVLQIVGMRSARFNPDQVRDDRGRWTGGGGGSSGSESGSTTRFAKIERKFPPANPDGLDTQQRYKLADGTYTPERQKLHEEIQREMIGDATPVDAPVGYIIGGGWAAGKSTILKTGEVSIPANHVRSDGDANKLLLPEYKQLVGKDPHISGYVHEESSDIAKRMTAIAAEGKYNVVLDGTGDGTFESLAKKVDTMKRGGLRVEANYVTVDTATAIERAQERGRKTGRYVPEEGLRNVHREVSRILPKAMSNGLFDSATLWDTNSGKPIKVASSKGADVTIHDQKLWSRFLAKADE
jgi:uncharacterized protein